MTDFHEIRFPDNIAYGATGGPEFATTVVVTGAGHEQRNVNWAEARGRWDVGTGPEEPAATRSTDRLLPGAEGRGLWLSLQGLDGLQSDRTADWDWR